jgi:hypothetical protein
VPTTTAPSGNGVITGVRRKVLLVFFGTDAEDEQFNVRVLGWRKIDDLWIPRPIVTTALVTLGAATGIVSELVDDTQFFADTIGAAGAGSDSDLEIVSPTNDLLAGIILNPRGAQRVEVVFDRTSAADCNALYATY